MNLLFRNDPIKKLTIGLKKSGGKNFCGKKAVQHIGGGFKRKYRIISFFRTVLDVPGKIRRIEYDPNRSAYIALVCFKNSYMTYIVAGEGLKVNDIVINSVRRVPIAVSNSTLLQNISVGVLVNSVEFFPNAGLKIARAAGTYAQVLKRINENYVLLRLKSKEHRIFHKNVFCSFGRISNSLKKFEKMYKAGQLRYSGKRPVVRGEAKNPVDHPHGGNTSGGRHPRTPKGKLTRGVKTRDVSKVTNNFIFKIRQKQG